MSWPPVTDQHPGLDERARYGAEPGAVDRARRRVVRGEPPAAVHAAGGALDEQHLRPLRMPGQHDLAGTDPMGAQGQQPVAGTQGRLHGTFGHLDPQDGPVHGIPPRVSAGDGSSVESASSQAGERESMRLLTGLLEPKAIAHAHCDLPCGVYDPAQARIEAESIKGIAEKYAQNTDPEFRARAIFIKEQRSELVKHHLWVLWTDYFKPPHFEKYPQLHQLFNEATKLAGAAGTKGSVDVGKADELLAKIEEISKIFWETKQA